MKVPLQIALAAALALLAAALPLANVSAHTCDTLTPHAPTTPTDADTGCVGSSCPTDSGVPPHHHKNTVPPAECRNETPASGCTGKNHGQSGTHGKGGSGGGGLPSAQDDGAALRRVTGEVVALCHNAGQVAPGAAYHCEHWSPHSHVYGTGLSWGTDSRTASAATSFGLVTVEDTNPQDCDGDGIAADDDGDYETGMGGAFFGFGPWANEDVCDYGRKAHGGYVQVNDVTWGSSVLLVIGADDTSGPVIEVDPVDGSTSCSTDGGITPGDPSADPTADPDDCLSEVFVGSGTTCGAGGDGGYWVFLYGGYVVDGAGSLTLGNPPTAGTITA